MAEPALPAVTIHRVASDVGPDEVIPEVFASVAAPALRPGSARAFGSGYVLAFGLVRPPVMVDDITSGAFARSFQAEADGGYPMLAIARELMNEASAMTEAESRLRNAVGLPEPSAEEW
ncbi:MAG TPA: hypothetical protein VGM22_17080 [Methylomirabilota bacterium]|jgi:ketol-acid reductoisomerase